MKIICISGKARSGKDTAAGLIQNHLRGNGRRVLITHYADLLKFMCKQLFDWNGKKDERGRELLQYVGTDLVRAQDPDFWVDFIIKELKIFSGLWDYVIIPDCRFPNELNRFCEEGFQVTHVHVQREGYENNLTQTQKNHPSETAMQGVPADYTLRNQGTIADLMADVLNMLNKIFEE